MKVTDIMTSNPACCTPEASLSEVANLMIRNDCGEIPIIESDGNRKLVGVVTDRDIVIRAVAKDASSDSRVSEIMTRSVVSIGPDADLAQCCEKMEDNQIRRIPVTNDQGEILGIVAQADVALHTGAAETAEVVRDISQPSH
ncbi:MAG: CBS domain-containing protein [Pseudohongiellaceae bacterium]